MRVLLYIKQRNGPSCNIIVCIQVHFGKEGCCIIDSPRRIQHSLPSVSTGYIYLSSTPPPFSVVLYTICSPNSQLSHGTNLVTQVSWCSTSVQKSDSIDFSVATAKFVTESPLKKPTHKILMGAESTKVNLGARPLHRAARHCEGASHTNSNTIPRPCSQALARIVRRPVQVDPGRCLRGREHRCRDDHGT